MPLPAFLQSIAGTTLVCAPTEGELGRVADLLEHAYWNEGRFSRDEIIEAHRRSSAWVGARDTATGQLVATARALSDGAKYAWIYDVIVDPAWRRRVLGSRVVSLLLDHPAVRHARFVLLGTADAEPVYLRLGFVDRASIARPYATTEMVLVR